MRLLILLALAAPVFAWDVQPRAQSKPQPVVASPRPCDAQACPVVEYAGPIRGPVPVFTAPITARSVPASIPFHAGHNCPQCGREQYRISSYLPGGQHVHVCAAGHAWRHN